MRKNLEKRDLNQVLAEIENLDLEPVRFKIACKDEGLGWTTEHSARIELGYRRFLMLVAKYPERQIAPTRDIDKFWHAHILDTRKYAADCQRIFGEFKHHNPYLGMRGDEDKLSQAANRLHDLFESEFGEPVPANAAEPGAASAWCGVEVAADKSAAWCGVDKAQRPSTAWCGVEKAQRTSAAWYGVEKERRSAAWCGVEAPAQAAAWCGIEDPASKAAAWCGVEVRPRAAQVEEAEATASA